MSTLPAEAAAVSSSKSNANREPEPRTLRGNRVSTWLERCFIGLCMIAIAAPLTGLLVLIVGVIVEGAPRLDWDFITGYPSRHAAEAGILPPLLGSLAVVSTTAVLAVPIGIGAAIFLEEYGPHGRLAHFIEVNIANLAGVPSVIYGLLGLEIFVRTTGFGRSVIAGACTLALLILPIVIVASREALRTVPDDLREACYGLGSTRWQAIRRVVLPMALPGILTGAILAISRAIGETAPLILVAATAYLTFPPIGLDSPFTVLPIQIFNWTSRPDPGFVANAAAGIVVLLTTLMVLNGVAIYLRHRFEKSFQR